MVFRNLDCFPSKQDVESLKQNVCGCYQGCKKIAAVSLVVSTVFLMLGGVFAGFILGGYKLYQKGVALHKIGAMTAPFYRREGLMLMTLGPLALLYSPIILLGGGICFFKAVSKPEEVGKSDVKK